MTVNPTLLRRVLWFDALSGLGMAALFLIAGGLVAELTGLPRGLLAATGIALVVIAGGILLIATRLCAGHRPGGGGGGAGRASAPGPSPAAPCNRLITLDLPPRHPMS
jgi:hypothetical protein